MPNRDDTNIKCLEYTQDSLMKSLENLKIDVIWLPYQSPETYSFALTDALNSKLPIVASDVGAIKERLIGRAYTVIVEPETTAPTVITSFKNAINNTISIGKLNPELKLLRQRLNLFEIY
jgi:glycosyltransferase involved in cell wall biosynthesis